MTERVSIEKKIRVLHVQTMETVGGTETYINRVIQTYDRARFQMDVCATGYRSLCLVEEFESAGSRVWRCRHSFWVWPFALRLRRILREGRYDAVVDYSGDMAAGSMIGGLLAGVGRRVVFYRSAGVSYRPTVARRLYAWVMRLLVRRLSSFVLSNSAQSLNRFHPGKELNQGKFHVIPNGLDVGHYTERHQERRRAVRSGLGVDEDCVVIGHIGSLRPEKDHATLISAVDLIASAVPNVVVVLLGEGRLRESIELDIEERGLGGVVRLLGFRSDSADLLQGMDHFLFPSKFEGSPNALQEAQCAGLPIVATDRPEMRESVPSENHDWLAAAGDAEAFASVFLRQRANPGQTAEKASLGRRFVIERFDLGKNLERACSFYVPGGAVGSSCGRVVDEASGR
jgi:glycosyltransferase EpsF